MRLRQIIRKPSYVSGTVELPASKSISNRLLMLRALCGADGTPIENLSDARDTRIMRDALHQDVSVHPQINVADAGTAMRFLTAYFAMQPQTVILSGAPRMHQRPIAPLVNALNQLGADIDYLERPGYPPLLIHQKMAEGGRSTISGQASSQFSSALMMIGPFMRQGLSLFITPPRVSFPYIRMTQRLMHQAGLQVDQDAQGRYQIPPASFPHFAHTEVEADWSAAAFMLALLALSPDGGTIFLPHLRLESAQGDCSVLKRMASWGIRHREESGGLTVFRNAGASWPSGFEDDMLDAPDLIPPLAALCIAGRLPFRIRGIQTLRDKECDRVAALQELAACHGMTLHAHYDTMETYVPQSPPSFSPEPTVFRSRDDHRMVMSALLLATQRPLAISEPDAVQKSYPGFWSVLEQLGFGFVDSVTS